MSNVRTEIRCFRILRGDRGPRLQDDFPAALQAMAGRGLLDIPVIGVAKAGWDLDRLKARARESVECTAESMSSAFFSRGRLQ